MTRPILLELALCIIQEIVSNGIERVKTLAARSNRLEVQWENGESVR